MDRRKIEVAGFPLIKFQSNDKIQSLRDGVLYMKNLEYYRNREKADGDDTVGDLFEAMVHVNEATLIVEETNTVVKLKDKLLPTRISNGFVFCMFGVNPDSQSFTFSEEQKQKIINFGDTALLITDSDEFLRRVIFAAKKQQLEGFHGFVKYYDEQVDSANILISLVKGMENIVFMKREKYRYQHEYRFFFESAPTEDDYYKLEIGCIKDISEVLTTSAALDGLVAKSKLD